MTARVALAEKFQSHALGEKVPPRREKGGLRALEKQLVEKRWPIFSRRAGKTVLPCSQKPPAKKAGRSAEKLGCAKTPSARKTGGSQKVRHKKG